MRKHTILLSCLLLLSNVSFTQVGATEQLKSFARKALLFNYKYPQEKAYLHFDNTGYFLGETIWFKSYVVEATNTTPTSLSKTLYVELLTTEGDLLQQSKIKLSNGVGSGSFYLPDSLPGGYYEVRAYTRSMLNFGNETVFSRVFPVYSAPAKPGDFTKRLMQDRTFRVSNLRLKDKADDAVVANKSVNVSFYPESGNLIVGLPINMAFKATNKSGSGIDVVGTLYNEQKKEVCTFSSVHQGMGSFAFTPDSGRYTAKIVCDGKEHTVELPQAQASGYALSLSVPSPTSGSMQVDLRRTPDLPIDTLALSVLCRGKLVDFHLLTIPDKGQRLILSTKNFPQGVNQLTLYASDGRVLTDRLFFVYPKGLIKDNVAKTHVGVALLDASINKTQYAPFERIQLTLSAADTANTNTGTSVSLAVRDAATSNFSGPDNSSIAATLLLSSDLKGAIYNPQWYFKSADQAHIQALDLLMLTQGWRRYKWQRMEGLEAFTPKHPIEEGLVADGEVRTTWMKKPVSDVDVNMWMTRGGSSLQGKAKTDSMGRYSFLIPDLYDEWQLNINTKLNDKNKDYRILINRQFSPPPRILMDADKMLWMSEVQNSTQSAKSTSDSVSAILGIKELKPTSNTGKKMESNEHQLKEVVVGAKKAVSFKQDLLKRASVSIDVDVKLDQIRDKGESEESSVLDFLTNQLPGFNYGESFRKIKNGNSWDLVKFLSVTYKTRPVRFKVFPNDGSSQNALSEAYVMECGNTICNDPCFLVSSDIERISILEDHELIFQLDPRLSIDEFYLWDFSTKSISPLKRIKNYPEQDEDPIYIFLFLKKDFGEDPLGVRSTPFQGYTLSKEFYSPIYQEGEPVLDPDYRRTLYWNPEIILDKKGKASVEFYNNGTSKQFTVSAEGITSNGVLLQNK